jgi:hypothetical protein
MGDKSVVDSTYVENSSSYAPFEKLLNSDDSSSDDESTSQELQDADNDTEVTVTQKKLNITLPLILTLVEHLSSKKRGEYPTTMDKTKKAAANVVNISTLARASRIHLTDRQYQSFASKVAKAALNMPPAPTTPPDKDTARYETKDMDMKALFGLPLKNMSKLSTAQLKAGKDEIASHLFRLRAELTRIPVSGVEADLTQEELMANKKKDSETAAADKKRIGIELLQASVTGDQRKGKRAKVQRGGSNDHEVQREHVQYSSTEDIGSPNTFLANSSAEQNLTPSTTTLSALTAQANTLLLKLTQQTALSPGPVTLDMSMQRMPLATVSQNTIIACNTCDSKNGTTRINCWKCECPLN